MSERLQAIEYSSTLPKIDLKEAIFKVSEAWEAVSNTTIVNCFRKAGFKNQDSVVIESNYDDPNIKEYKEVSKQLNLIEAFDSVAHKTMDDLLPVTESYDEASILSSIEPTIKEVLEEEEPKPVVTSKQALDCLHKLRDYYLMRPDECTDQFNLISKMRSDIARGPKKQSKISDYLIIFRIIIFV